MKQFSNCEFIQFFSPSYNTLGHWPLVYNFPTHNIPRPILALLEDKASLTEPQWSKLLEAVYDDVTKMTL